MIEPATPRVSQAIAFAVLLSGLGLSGCTADIPDGQIRCASAAECPRGWFCNAGLCYAAPDGPPHDAGPADAAEIDAALDAAFDAARLDAGPDAMTPDADPGRDGGCMPAVYGTSVFGSACFQ